MNKKIYTSNYVRQKGNPKAISISASHPTDFIGQIRLDLAPTWDILKAYKEQRIDTHQYVVEYIKLLNQRNINPHQLIKELPDNSVLLCYEPPGEFCHRRVLAHWVERYTDFKIVEWLNPQELEKIKETNAREQLIDSILGL